MNLLGLRVDADRVDDAGFAGHPDRQIERIGMADRVDRHVDSAVRGQALDNAAWVLLGQVDDDPLAAQSCRSLTRSP